MQGANLVSDEFEVGFSRIQRDGSTGSAGSSTAPPLWPLRKGTSKSSKEQRMRRRRLQPQGAVAERDGKVSIIPEAED
jgi:hypothetical protein